MADERGGKDPGVAIAVVMDPRYDEIVKSKGKIWLLAAAKMETGGSTMAADWVPVLLIISFMGVYQVDEKSSRVLRLGKYRHRGSTQLNPPIVDSVTLLA